MKIIRKWTAALTALSLALAFFAAMSFTSCSNASGGSGNAETQNGGTPAGGGQGGTQGPEGGQAEAPIDPALKVPLTLEAIEAGAVVTFCNKAEGAVTYKVNDGEAQTIAKDETKAITLENIGDKVAFYGDNKVYASHPWPSDDWSFESYTRSSIDCSADCYVYGNIMSLIKSENFAKADFEKDISQAFFGLFAKNTHIKNKDGSDLLLPAATATNGCYKNLFKGCSGLTKAPALPATKLEASCYDGMFLDCTSLTTAPALPASAAAEYCYSSMFEGCANLENAPNLLPATTLANYCYSCMFKGCVKLAKAPELPATILQNFCYYEMFYGCASMTTAPALPAATLQKGCYERIFNGCSSLSSVTCLATDISPQNCVYHWMKGVAATGTFTRAEQMHDWPTGGSSGIPTGWEVKGGKEPTGAPLTLEAVSSAATVTFVNKAEGPVWYKVNGGEKQTIASGETKEIALAAAGDKVAFYGNNGTYAKELRTINGNVSILTGVDFSNITCSASCYVYGNIMSLVSSTDYDVAKILGSTHTFYGLFQNNINIKNKAGEDLRLPATTLTGECYGHMFYGCKSLTKAPDLPATTLSGWNCYSHMFSDCSELTTAPALPATTLVRGCYERMFQRCDKLTEAPSLPAITMQEICYEDMFGGCFNLTTPPELPATDLASRCYSGMFKGCTKLSAAPTLPAKILVKECYITMFEYCTNLSSVTCLATDISAQDCTTDWLSGVKSSGTFTKAASMTSWTTGTNGIPSGWTVEDYQAQE